MNARPISEDDLQAYVDNALDGQRLSEVVAYLDEHPEVSARIEAYLSQRTGLREALAPVADEPVPARLNLARLIEADSRRFRLGEGVGSWKAGVAAMLLLCIGGTGGWSLHGSGAYPRAGIASLAQEARESYAVYAPDLGRPVEIKAAEQAQLVKWASRRLDRPVTVPDLTSSGFQFIGGRLVATPHGPAAMYMFDNGRGTRLVMLTRNMAVDKDHPLSQQADGPVATASWSRDGLGFSLAGPLTSEALTPIARKVGMQVLRDS